ncbi:hypothetical protein [Pseudosporangium ferrugineum]|uniref:Bacterial CdiA-CT RNAse A domain-containing protein n=1 Tax=Pseudosporangium ferrugineum TaxID=439699 RepID=A0A2T0RCP9_9ACTN|nr:hypothetical protein [Pseudosporangium ferrugineum]PRY18937.1 hypothetical protein CLV70_14116 [Pseudosporangium ferrugineum]
MTGRPRGHGDGGGGDGGSPPRGHGAGGPGSVAQAQGLVATAAQAGRPTAGARPGSAGTHDGGPAELPRPTDPEEARVLAIYQKLGDEPPEINIAANDAEYGGLGAHTQDRHGPAIPLHRDPDPQSGNRTVEGRIYGDAPWPNTQNWSYRWTDPGTMNRTVNAYLRDNWEGIRSDLALDGEHEGKIVAGNAVGQGYYNPGMHGAGPRSSTFGVTSMAKIRIKLVPGSDPPIPFIVTTFPSGT